ncbi:UNVERIFIED_CONTAM: hypothetical protein K2H54_041533 [Gekko kuhli]
MIPILVGTILMLARTWMDVFILTVNGRDWIQKKRLSTTDSILTLQGAIRICLGCLDLIWSILQKCCPWITRIRYVLKAFKFSFRYLIYCNVWLTASLCSYYCVKIADFSHPFFIHLKLRLSGLVSTWLLGSAILSLASTLPFAYILMEIQDNRNFSNFFQNKNETDISHTGMVSRILPSYWDADSIGCISPVNQVRHPKGNAVGSDLQRSGRHEDIPLYLI